MSSVTSQPVRLGVLGCAGVTDYAILYPAREEGALSVVAVASRDARRAVAWAAERGIAASYGSYDALLAAGGFDAVYVPLPNALHCEWAIKALRAGYPVLCEKPLASNAAQAAEMVAVSRETGQPLVEAFHWRHHPFVARMMEIVRSGELGRLRRIDGNFRVLMQAVSDDNIRTSYELGGGALMDQGCYCISLARHVVGAEPLRVISAQARRRSDEIDDAMIAELEFPDGIRARIDVSMRAEGDSHSCLARIEGEQGVLTVTNPYLTMLGCRLTVETAAGSRTVMEDRTATYIYQARDFAALVRGERPPAILPVEDGVANMAVIDAIYMAAGMKPRQ
jgi:predicted dehydrogenase